MDLTFVSSCNIQLIHVKFPSSGILLLYYNEYVIQHANRGSRGPLRVISMEISIKYMSFLKIYFIINVNEAIDKVKMLLSYL